jgi:hypothetical protein
MTIDFFTALITFIQPKPQPMEMNLQLPEELLINIGTETKEFSVKSRFQRSPSRYIGQVGFGIVWLSFVLGFAWLALGDLITGGSTDAIVNGEPVTITADNLKSGLPLIIFLGVFISIGLGVIISGLFSMFKSGGWFVGTPNRLIWFRKGVLKSLDWSQFNGNIEIKGSNKRGNLTLEMKTGSMKRSKGGSYYVPDVVYFIGIPDVYEIEKIVRRRIEENQEK